MKPYWKPALLFGLALIAAGGSGLAQNTPPAARGPLYDPQQLPVFKGEVRQFTLTPRGEIDGLILTDGTEVKTPPHLSTAMAYAIRPGDSVTIHGLHAAALPLMQAVSITDDATGRTVLDAGPPRPEGGPGAGPAVSNQALTQIEGRIRMPLHGPRGDVNGALLEDGTVLRLPPPEAERFATLLQPGQTVAAAGTELANPIGKVLEVREIGASRDQLDQVQAPPGPGPGGKKGRRGPPPA
jgi:hypothetical protein